MSLLKKLVQEMDAASAVGSTTAANIAANPYATGGSLFAGGAVDPSKAKKRQRKMFRRIVNLKTEGENKKKSFINSLLDETLGVDLGGSDFDAADVVSRIDDVIDR